MYFSLSNCSCKALLQLWAWVTCCSVTQPCLTLCDPMDCSKPGFLVLHHLLELAHTHVHWVSDAIQPSCPLSSPSPPAFNLPQHLSQVFSNESSLLIRWPMYWSFNFSISPSNEYSGLISSGLIGLISLLSKGLSSLAQHHSSKASILQFSAFLWSSSHIDTWLLKKS